MTDEERLSLIVSESLNVLGYSEDVVKARRTYYDKVSEAWSRCIQKNNSDTYCTLTGSKREGLASSVESESDIMLTDTSIQCTDNPAAVTRKLRRNVRYIFELDRENVPHGYTKLRLAYRNPKNVQALIENSLVGCGKELYLPSALLMSEMEKNRSSKLRGYTRKPRAGPSLPSDYETIIHSFTRDGDIDLVQSFPCQCSEYLMDWLNRPRHYDWPSKINIDIASKLDAHVVPVGAKGSENEFMQWRICFTPAEVMLMQSLNETQWKLYKLLKMIKVDLLPKPLGDLVTSYVMKNVVMWISELYPLEQFQPIYLLHNLQLCVHFLASCLDAENMPNYMIRQRNLFQGRINQDNKKQYLRVLNALLQDGRAMVIRCPKLKETMIHVYAAPDAAKDEMSLRDTLETKSMRTDKLPVKDLDVLIELFSYCSSNDERLDAPTSFANSMFKQLCSSFGLLPMGRRYINKDMVLTEMDKFAENSPYSP